jgi:hypothetical protein
MQSMIHYRALVVLLLAVASGCSNADANPSGRRENPMAAPARDFSVEAFDFAFRAADTIHAGLTRIRMKNAGPAMHHVTVVKLDQGHTIQELLASISAGTFAPSWATYVGGPEPMPLHTEGSVTVDLAPGNYALLCFISGKDHIRHLDKGMVRALTVLPAGPSAPTVEVVADARMTLRDYGFEITPALTPGRRTIRVENVANQPHHAELIRLHEGRTFADAREWGRTSEGPPPFDFVGGVSPLSPGQVNHFTADLVPGTYVLVCFFPDANDGKPHIAHGMVREFRIE